MSVTTHYSPIHRHVEKLLREKCNNCKAEYCLECLEKSLRRTSHLARVTVVAHATSLCRLAARLMQSIGVSYLMNMDVPGKPGRGTAVHRVLAASSIDLLNKWKTGGFSAGMIGELVEGAVERLALDENAAEVKRRAESMLKNLLSVLPLMVGRMGLHDRLGQIRVYAEPQLIDYKVHMIGVPDLLIEFPKERRAIVVEWKTYEDAKRKSPSEVEWAQAYAYALLEALRLGYLNSLEETLDAIATGNLRDAKVLPVIVTPSSAYVKHPAFSHPGRIKGPSVDELKLLLEKLVLASLHLTLLVVNMGYLLAPDEQHIQEVNRLIDEYCRPKGHKISVFHFMPENLRIGSPRTQNKYPCTVCPFSDEKNNGRGPCSFYFDTQGKEKTRWDRLMWFYRHVVYGERENVLKPYRLLYLVSLFERNVGDLYEKVKGGVLIEFSDLDSPPIIRGCSDRSSDGCGVIKVGAERYFIGAYDVDGIDGECILLSRELYPSERILENRTPPRLATPRMRKPVLMSFIEPHVPTLTLSINVYAKVESVLLPGQQHQTLGYECPKDRVCVVLTPTSSLLSFPFELAREYFELYGLKRAILAEVNADLTHVDLRTIDALHRYRGEGEEDIPEEVREDALRSLRLAYESLGLSIWSR